MIRHSSPMEIMILLPALILALTVHELCHGLSAYALGDATAKRDGRLSLNPIKHIDPIGMLFILIVGFGWAKPVMVTPSNLKNPKVDMALIALSGPLSNFVLSFVALLITFPLITYIPNFPVTVANAMITFSRINVVLGIFNLIPIPPLDGSKVIAGILPESVYKALPPVGGFGMLILLVLMITGVTANILFPMVDAVFGAFISAVISIFDFIL